MTTQKEVLERLKDELGMLCDGDNVMEATLNALRPNDPLGNGLVAQQGWQPIETAPKDGTWILLRDDRRTSVGSWFPPSPTNPVGWWSAYRATSWMPIPAPPEDNGDD